MSQKEFAKFFGLAESTISMYERDERRPDFDLLNKFADYFRSQYRLPSWSYRLELLQQERDDAAFKAFANDPELNVFYKELPKSDEEAVRKLRNIWEIIKNEKKNRTRCKGSSFKNKRICKIKTLMGWILFSI
ncbi:helix-turn-helix transcriptional regulator [Lysinibacillus capsici]